MSQSIDLKSAERSTFKLATYTDGLNDISFGLVLVLLSVYSLTRNLLGPVLNAIFIIVTTMIIAGSISVFKNRLVPPQVGLVKFSPPVKKRLRNALIVTAVFVGVTLATWFLSTRDSFKAPIWARLPQWVTDFDVDIIFSLLIIAFFFVLAYSFAVPRFYSYGLLIGFGNLLSVIQLSYYGVLFQYPLALAGLVITGVGIYFLIRFLNTYPIPTQEA